MSNTGGLTRTASPTHPSGLIYDVHLPTDAMGGLWITALQNLLLCMHAQLNGHEPPAPPKISTANDLSAHLCS